MIGTTVSHYKILEKIGEGGMGEVFLAEDTKLRRQVSLKFLSQALTQDETRKQRFIQEARAAAGIEHPHIAAIHDIDEADGRTFIAMEYVRGESLRETINAGKLNLRRSLELGFQIADGLAKAHERGVVHRDIKPENILVSEDGYAKIIDFGLAKLLEPLAPVGDGSEADTATHLKTREGVVMGTVSYMSPEQATGATVDGRSDVFSFGIVLYEMLTGESPFRKASLAESLGAVLHTTPPALEAPSVTIPPELQRILKKTLAKEPGDRYQNMKDLAIDLRNLREDSTSTAVTPHPGPLPRAERVKLWLLAAAAAVVIAGLTFFLTRPSAPPGIGASGRPAIAVMYFESMSGDEEVRWLSKGLPNMLITDLAQTPGLDVISSQRIQKILKQIGEEDLESLDQSVIEEVARRAGAGAVVMGSIFKSGDEIRLDVQVQDVESGRILSAESVRGEDVFSMVDEITGRIRASLSLGDRPEGRPLAEVTTASLEAFQLYSEGHEAVLNLRLGDAQEPLARAVEIDPSFAMAYLDLAYLARRRGEPDVEISYLDKAYEKRERLPERQKLAVEARFAGIREHDTERMIDLLETLVSRYPDEESAHVFLASEYLNDNRPEESESAARRGLEALPDSGPLYNMHGYALLQLHRYPEAVRALEAYARVEPEEPNARDSLGEALLITGQPEKALESYARAMEVDPSFEFSRSGRSYAYAMMGRYDDAAVESKQLAEFARRIGFPPTVRLFMDAFVASRLGRIQKAQEDVEKGVAVAEGLGNIQRAAALELVGALIAVEGREYRAAFQFLDRVEERILKVSDPRWKNGLAVNAAHLRGISLARSGNIEAARAQLEISRKVHDDRDEADVWIYRALEGEIALTEGHLEAAEKAFLAGEPKIKMWFSLGNHIPTAMSNNWPFHDGVARVKKAQGKSAEAIAIYRDLLEPDMGSKWTMWLQPRYVLELARLLDETGDKEGARAEYERFLEFWKDADEGLPELEEAREYLGT